MKKLLLFLFLTPTLATAQYNLTLYQLHETVPQANFLNPGLLPNGQIVIGFPGISNVHASTSVPLSAEMLFTKNLSNNLVLDIESLPDKLGKQNFIQENISVDPLFLGFWSKRNFISFHLGARQSGIFGFPKSIIEYAVEGNGGANLGKSVEFNDLIFKSSGYMEFGVGYGRATLNDRFSWGIRAKYLYGGYHASINQGSGGYLTTDPETYAISLAIDELTLNTAGLTAFGIDPFSDEGHDGDNGSEDDILEYLANNQNRGFALDFGFKAKLTDKFRIYASLIDLGSIRWKTEVKNYNFSNTTYTFEGIDIRNADNFDESIMDTLNAIFDPEISYDSYTETLSSKFYAGGEFIMGKKHTLGAVAYGQFVKGKLRPALNINYNLKLGRTINTAITYNIMNRSHNLGAGLSFNMGFLQFYTTTDNVFAFVNPHKTKSADLRAGMNLTFGRKRHERILQGLPGNKRKAREIQSQSEEQ